MKADALRWLGRAGVLGMNRRNADYLLRWNPRRALPRVDDKVLTKQLAEEHGVPTPRLLTVVRSHGELRGLDARLEPFGEFVVKPARGSGGSGIVLVTGRTPTGWTLASGGELSRDDLRYHCSGILSGIHSLEGLEDKALVEALVHVDPVFAEVTYRGVPDIRLIVYRGVPVMGMVRLPTRASDGKANLHRGAIGAGLRLRDGETMHAVHRTMLIERHPDTGQPVRGLRVPHWTMLLDLAARTCDMTGLGYLGADWVLDRGRGPLLLELNARPGLAIQLANGAGLRPRLEAVDAAPPEILATAASRVAWARERF